MEEAQHVAASADLSVHEPFGLWMTSRKGTLLVGWLPTESWNKRPAQSLRCCWNRSFGWVPKRELQAIAQRHAPLHSRTLHFGGHAGWLGSEQCVGPWPSRWPKSSWEGASWSLKALLAIVVAPTLQPLAKALTDDSTPQSGSPIRRRAAYEKKAARVATAGIRPWGRHVWKPQLQRKHLKQGGLFLLTKVAVALRSFGYEASRSTWGSTKWFLNFKSAGDFKKCCYYVITCAEAPGARWSRDAELLGC